MVYYKLVLTLVTAHCFQKLFCFRDEAAIAFTIVSRCCSFEPFGPWYTDRFVVEGVQSLLMSSVTRDSVRDLIPLDFEVPPLTPPPDEIIIPWFAYAEWDNTFESLTLCRCHGTDVRVLERLDREELVQLGHRWEERTTEVELVRTAELI